MWLSGNHLEAAVFFVAVVQSQPGGDAGAWLYPQVELILMQSLAACAGRLEVEHRLHGEGFAPKQICHAIAQAAVQHPLQTEFIPAVHVDHAGIFLEGILAAGIDAGRVAGIGARCPQFHEMLPESLDLFFGEETAYIEETAAIEFAFLFSGQHLYRPHFFVEFKC